MLFFFKLEEVKQKCRSQLGKSGLGYALRMREASLYICQLHAQGFQTSDINI